MNVETLQKKHGATLSKMDVVAPVDLEYLFRDGLIEKDSIEGKRVNLTKKEGLYVEGDVVADSLTLTGHALFVVGNVHVKKLKLTGNMVVLGQLVADEVHGDDEFTLSVKGKVKVGIATTDHGFILQFLGGGQLDRLVDTDGGAEELIDLWREAGSKVKVKTTSDEL